MGLMKNLLTSEASDDEDYIELSEDHLQSEGSEADVTVKIAEIRGQQDMMAIKDAVYSGNMVFADHSNAEVNGVTMSRVKNELKELANEVGGEVVKTGDYFIITPSEEVRVSRERLN